MAEILIKQEDGTYIKVPIIVEVQGTGVVSYPNEEGAENG